MSERFTTRVGRFIQGNPFVPRTHDMKGNLLVVKSGPNKGQPSPQYFVGLAIAKTPGVTDWRNEQDPFFQAVNRVAQTDFPGGQWQRPDFAWKIIDGDSPALNRNGRAWNTMEGYPGHWVCRFESSYPTKCFARPNYAATDQITDPARIKRGHYITVNGSVKGNGDMTTNPGVFLNLDMVSWEGFGPEIVSGPDAGEAFAQAPQLPAGASAVPVVAPVTSPAAAGVPATPPPYAGYMGNSPPASVVAPPPVPSSVPPVTPVPGRVMLQAANGSTYEQMTAAGWTDALLVQHGMMMA